MPAPTNTKNPTKAAEVTPEVTVELAAPRPLGITPRPLFTTTVEEAPKPPAARTLNPKTQAEHAAGVAALSQYAVPE